MKRDTKLSPQGYLYESDGALHPFWEQDGGGGTGTVPDITATASVDGTTGTPSVNVTQDGEHGENIDFAFSGLKGEKGDKGDIGPQGPKGEDGTSVIPANIVKNVTMDATPDVTMGTTDYALAYRTNDDQKHNAQTMHLATKQLVLESAQTSAGTNGTDKVGAITLYTIDQSGNTGSQSFGIVAITQSDSSVSLCPALNKGGTWEYGQEFLKIPSVPQSYVKEAAVGAPKVENDMKYYPYREVSVKDGVEQHETTTNIGTFDPEHMVESVLLDTGLTSPSGKYTKNKATFKTRWNHGGVVTEQSDEFAINTPITDKNYTDVTMTSATTDTGTTYSLKKTDMDGKQASIGTIEVPKSGGGSGNVTSVDVNISSTFYCFSPNSTAVYGMIYQLPDVHWTAFNTTSERIPNSSIEVQLYELDGTPVDISDAHYEIAVEPSQPGFVDIYIYTNDKKFTPHKAYSVRVSCSYKITKNASVTADEIERRKAAYYKELSRHDVTAYKKKEVG